jgi:hypothetical protein
MRKNRKDSFAYEVSDKPTVFAISSGMWNRFAEIKAWLCLAWPRFISCEPKLRTLYTGLL